MSQEQITTNASAATTAQKTLRKGTRVKIYNTTYGGKLILEGVAKVVRKNRDANDYYRVQFDDGMCVDRFIQLENVL